MSTAPRVSVLLSVWNGAPFVKEAVESILAQTFADFELVIIDDGSTDATPGILASFSNPRIVLLRNDANKGLVYSLNKGLAAARGEYVARMDADDRSDPERFEKQVAFLDAHSEVGVLGSALRHVGPDGKPISVLRAPTEHAAILGRMLFEAAIFHATVMMRRKVIEEAGGYDAAFPHAEDTELWVRLVGRTKFANLGEPLYARRLHQDSVSAKHSDVQRKTAPVLRRRLFEKVVGVPMPEDPASLRAAAETYFEAVARLASSPLEKEELARERTMQMRSLEANGKRSLAAAMTALARRLLPVHLRHRLRHSPLGKFLLGD